MRVLVVEDSKAIVEVISVGLESRWPDIEIMTTGSGEAAVESAELVPPDIVLLDLGLADISGYEVLKRIRAFSNVPIIVLSVRAEEADVFRSLEWGADDYMTKPFSPAELFSRIQAVMRRRAPSAAGGVLTCGDLTLDPTSQVAHCQGRESRLTDTEGRILKKLMENAGVVVERGLLSVAVWGEDFATLNRLDPRLADASLGQHIRRLREKIERDADFPEMLITVPGSGYRLMAPG
jgi:two-component system response regulator VicR